MDEKMTFASPTRLAVPPTELMATLLRESAIRHKHLCPRQVLGVRLGLYGLKALGLISDEYQSRYRNTNKRLLTIVETDGCGSDGIAVSTDCAVGQRSLRVLDYGKVAVTLIDTNTENALRVSPMTNSRQLALEYIQEAESSWHAYLEAYQIIPDHELMQLQPVSLTRSIERILSRPSARVTCSTCGEEIFNERELVRQGTFICRSCDGDTYYRLTESDGH
jgi:formylmethanofuran dehydrogenase subunit E